MGTEEQRIWITTQEFVLNKIMEFRMSHLEAPAHPLRARCFSLVRWPLFDHIVMGAVILNTAVMGCVHFGQPVGVTTFIEVANYIFAIFFNIEAILKIAGLGSGYFYTSVHNRRYFDYWNIFDIVIVIGTDVGYIVKIVTGQNVGSFAMVLRAFRAGRIVRLVHGLDSMRHLFNTLVLTLPGLANIAM